MDLNVSKEIADVVNSTMEDESVEESSVGNLDQLFLMLMGIIILFMQAGFGFLEAGSVRSKNVTNILIKNFVDLTCGALSYVIIGYALAFGSGSSWIGWTGFAMIGIPFADYAYVFFQATFAATCATIVSGSMAERCNFNGYIIFSVLLTGLFYPIQSNWAWNGSGWLANTDFHDFAGSGVVHLAGGTIAFVGAYMLGPRLGRFQEGEVSNLTGHSVPLISLGAFILIFGFMAFNGGSQASIEAPGDGEIIGRAVINTLVAACIGGNTVLFIKKFGPGGGSWSLIQMINGCLVGMVSICAGVDAYFPWAAGLIAGVAGVGYLFFSNFMVFLKIDDPLDAVAVHGVGGIIGLLSAPILMDNGLIYGGETAWSMLLWNAIGALVFIAYNAVAGIAMFSLLKMLDILRVPEDQERTGLDWVKHKEPAYPIGSLIGYYVDAKSATKRGHIEDMEKVPGFRSITETTSISKVLPVKEADINGTSRRGSLSIIRKNIENVWTIQEDNEDNNLNYHK